MKKKLLYNKQTPTQDEALRFLAGISVKETDTLRWAAHNAYLDMSRRTLRLAKVNTDSIFDLGLRTVKDFVMEACQVTDHGKFDDLHRQYSVKLIETFNGKIEPGYVDDPNNNGSLTVGQTQKWLNMTMKYLWMSEICGLKGKEDGVSIDAISIYLHAPLDRYILEEANRCFEIDPPENKGSDKYTWSKIVSYEEYLRFQTDLRTRLQKEGNCPIIWELKAWNRR